jgi:hypothetical protein
LVDTVNVEAIAGDVSVTTLYVEHGQYSDLSEMSRIAIYQDLLSENSIMRLCKVAHLNCNGSLQREDIN